jgi:deoxyribodipyrimidine photo-lyase
MLANSAPRHEGREALLRQLYWRDFSAYLLHHFPRLPHAPLRTEFSAFPWVEDANGLRAWQKGLTGYPIVDAGMRQLLHTGWMHNRVRMIVASFLVKDLLISWRRGAEWFQETLVDADMANNSASWQWVAGCGTDAAPYFRIFNPVLQGRKFDPTGYYVRCWVPELARLPAHRIHEPWKASAAEQRTAGAVVGVDYPAPIVDHGRAREAALTAYESIRKQAGKRINHKNGAAP